MERIEVSRETAQLIRAKAEAQGVTVDAYLRSLVGTCASQTQAGMNLAEIDQILDELATGSENLPPLPENFSREDM
jgi:hypothetical protein